MLGVAEIRNNESRASNSQVDISLGFRYHKIKVYSSQLPDGNANVPFRSQQKGSELEAEST